MCEEEGPPAQWLRLIQNLRLFPGQKWNYLGRNFIKRMCGIVFKKVIFCCNMVCRQSLLPVFASDKAGQHEWGTGFCERLADLQQAVAVPFVLEQPCPSQGEGGVGPRPPRPVLPWELVWSIQSLRVSSVGRWNVTCFLDKGPC